MKCVAAVCVIAALAGCGATRIVHVTDHRAKIHDNTATPAQVHANFAGKPADAWLDRGWHCEAWGSRQRVIDGEGTAWVLRVCYRGLGA